MYLGVSMFKSVLALALVVALTAAKPQAKPKGAYTTKYDNIDLDEILTNDRLYKNYFACLTNKGKCTPDGSELKKVLPEALASGCSKCNDRQKQGTEKVLKFLVEKKPADYEVLEKQYDPEGTYRKKYKSIADKHGVKL